MHTAQDILVIADDLTGALEAGAAFAANGVNVSVTLGGKSNAQVQVIDAETRHLSDLLAASRVTQIVKEHPSNLIYKKTDSTLRGNIRAELEALRPFGHVFYVPAYPRLGRTLIDGCLHVDGVPLRETAFANDPLNPVADDNIERLLNGLDHVTISHAKTQDEIDALAIDWLEHCGIAAGPTGFLHAAASLLKSDPLFTPCYPVIDRVVVAVGSRHDVSRQQSAFAGETGWLLMKPSASSPSDPLACAAQFAGEVTHQAFAHHADALVVFGGDTAYAILTAMGVQSLQPIGEVLPGVPVSVLPNGLIFITKAGGFGPPDVLRQLHKALTHAPS